jgi:hypothetical protein
MQKYTGLWVEISWAQGLISDGEARVILLDTLGVMKSEPEALCSRAERGGVLT